MGLLVVCLVPGAGCKIQLPRKGIGFAMSVSWVTRDFEVIVGKENCPLSLSAIQGAGRSKIEKVFVVGYDLNTVLGPS